MDRCSLAHASDEPSTWTPDSDETTNARELCLRNSDLLEEILGLLSSASDHQDIKTQRQTLLWIALTCKDFLPSAIKFLWRRLDNLLPLLRLLRSFTERDGVYCLFEFVMPNEWTSFDRHAKHVREIVYEDIPDTIQVEPSVYLRLGLRNSPILPNVWRFTCGGTTSGPSASETLLYMQSPLRALELSSVGATLNPIPAPSMEMTRAVVVSSLREKPAQISHLILVAQPVTILDDHEGIPLDKLTSLELTSINAAGADSLLRRIGSLPHLRSFKADSTCITLSAIRNLAPSTASHVPSNLFMELTDLRLTDGPRALVDLAPLDLFLLSISSSKLRFLTLRITPSPLALQQARVARAAALRLILNTIPRRWSKSLRQLDLEVYHSYAAILNLLGGLSSLCSLKLSGAVLGIPVGKSLCSMFAGLHGLETLSLRCQVYFRNPLSKPVFWLDLRSIAGLALICPRLRGLDIPISASELPPLASTQTISLNLRTITVIDSNLTLADTLVNTIALARCLDQMFPRLNSLRYDTSSCERGAIWSRFGERADINPSGQVAAWAQVQELVLAFQDVRRVALAHQ